MKIIKKIAAIMLSVMMVLGMCSVVGAEGITTSGTKGKITINEAKDGQTYTIYQILELESFSEKPTTGETDAGNYAYKATDKWGKFVSEAANTNGKKYFIEEGGYVKWNPEVGKEAGDIEEFAKKALAYAKDSTHGVTNNGTKSASGTKVIFENLTLGYYLVDSSVGTLCSLTTTDTDVTIQEKNGVPSVEKKVQEDSDNHWDEKNTADIGQTVNFKTTITAQAGAQNYVLHDKMDAGLTFDESTVKVQRQVGSEVAKDVNTGYTVKRDNLGETDPDVCTFHIEFEKTFCDTLQADEKIIITYSATLNENATVGITGNKNKTWLKYGEKTDLGTTPSETTTKTYEIPVFKYTEKTTGTKTGLPNAKFTLSKNKNGTEPIGLVDITNGAKDGDKYRVAKTGETSITEITTPATGKFTIQGLDADTYYLTETKQPDGYNKLSNAVKIVIDENGNITVDDKTPSTKLVEVENKTGSILPSTGGMGTTLFYIFGAILVIGSGVVLITKKRMK